MKSYLQNKKTPCTPPRVREFLSTASPFWALIYRHILIVFSKLLNLLYKFDYLKDINFLDKMDLKKVEAKKDNRYLEQEEIDMILDELDHNIRYRNLVEFLINTGLRIEEYH